MTLTSKPRVTIERSSFILKGDDQAKHYPSLKRTSLNKQYYHQPVLLFEGRELFMSIPITGLQHKDEIFIRFIHYLSSFGYYQQAIMVVDCSNLGTEWPSMADEYISRIKATFFESCSTICM